MYARRFPLLGRGLVLFFSRRASIISSLFQKGGWRGLVDRACAFGIVWLFGAVISMRVSDWDQALELIRFIGSIKRREVVKGKGKNDLH